MLDPRIDPSRLALLLPAHRVREVHSFLIPENVQIAIRKYPSESFCPDGSMVGADSWTRELVFGQKTLEQARIALLDEYDFQTLLLVHSSFVQMAQELDREPDPTFPSDPSAIAADCYIRVRNLLDGVDGEEPS